MDSGPAVAIAAAAAAAVGIGFAVAVGAAGGGWCCRPGAPTVAWLLGTTMGCCMAEMFVLRLREVCTIVESAELVYSHLDYGAKVLHKPRIRTF